MFKPESRISEEELQTGLSYLVKDGIASQILVTLTTGAFMIAFAVALGAQQFF